MPNYIGKVNVDDNGVVSLPDDLTFNSEKVVMTLGKNIIYVFKPDAFQDMAMLNYEKVKTLKISFKDMIGFKRLFSAHAYESNIINKKMKISKNYIKKLNINDSLFIEAYDNYFKLYKSKEESRYSNSDLPKTELSTGVRVVK